MPSGDLSMFYPVNYLSEEKNSPRIPAKKFDLEKWYRYDQYKHDFSLFEKSVGIKINQFSSYLDIGCGSGERVAFIADSGCNVSFGLDKYDYVKNNSKLNINLINSEILNYFPHDKFQIVSLFHVLEHLDNPVEVLQHIKNNILAPNGYLIIQIPNYSSYERYIFGSRWFCFDAPRHLWHFNELALRNIMKNLDIHIVSVYASNAILHPVSIVSSIFRNLDVQKIWVDKVHSLLFKKMLLFAWAFFTILTIPLNWLQNILKKSSMLTIILHNK
jgi:SAM-dependent methyltransferase